MKMIFFISGFIFSAIFLSAQPVPQEDSWKVLMNKKTVLSVRQENEASNMRKIKSSEWKKSGNLELRYTESQKNFWRRSFHFYDENNNELLVKDSVSYVKIPLPVLRRLFAGKKEIRIYTTVAPLDPGIAVRLRRVHLCTLRLP